MLTEKTFAAKGMSINYAEGPPAGPPLVMLHGVTNRWQTWLPVLPLLGWQFHCCALDQRGHGRSGRAADGYQSDRFAQDVIQFLEQEIKQPVVLVGQSLGAMITLKVAAQAPDLIQAIVVSDPPLFAAADGDGTTPPWFQQYYDLVRARTTRDEKVAALAELTPDTDLAAIQAHLKCLEMLDPEVLLAGAADGLFVDFALADVLPKISCPTLLIRGNPDLGGVIEAQELQRALALIAKVTYIDVTDMGHNLHIPQPNVFAGLVSNFLQWLEPA
jgi:pimeloyl-ACP methyl ester carboxylesterase